MPGPARPIPLGRRLVVGGIAGGGLLGALLIARQAALWPLAGPDADEAPWAPLALCLADATGPTPAKLARARRRERNRLAAAAPADPS